MRCSKIHRDFEIQADQLIPLRKPDRVIVHKKEKENLPNSGLCFLDANRVKINENEKGDKDSDLARELKNLMELKVDGDTNCYWCARNDPQRLRRVRNRTTSRDYPNYSIVKIGQNTEKNPGDLRRLAVTCTQVKDHLLKLVWKANKES